MNESILVARACPLCGTRQTCLVPREQFERWKAGDYVQDAFPELSPDEREMFITGICPMCWPK
jgi:hypothetical protein